VCVMVPKGIQTLQRMQTHTCMCRNNNPTHDGTQVCADNTITQLQHSKTASSKDSKTDPAGVRTGVWLLQTTPWPALCGQTTDTEPDVSTQHIHTDRITPQTTHITPQRHNHDTRHTATPHNHTNTPATANSTTPYPHYTKTTSHHTTQQHPPLHTTAYHITHSHHSTPQHTQTDNTLHTPHDITLCNTIPRPNTLIHARR